MNPQLDRFRFVCIGLATIKYIVRPQHDPISGNSHHDRSGGKKQFLHRKVHEGIITNTASCSKYHQLHDDDNIAK